MCLKRVSARTSALLVVSTLGPAAYLAVSAASHAQAEPAKTTAVAPDAAALQKKVDLLEKQVEALQKQVAELKRQQATTRRLGSLSSVLKWNRVQTLPDAGLSARPIDPSLGTPFEFNGRTYYRMLLKNGETAHPAKDNGGK